MRPPRGGHLHGVQQEGGGYRQGRPGGGGGLCGRELVQRGSQSFLSRTGGGTREGRLPGHRGGGRGRDHQRRGCRLHRIPGGPEDVRCRMVAGRAVPGCDPPCPGGQGNPGDGCASAGCGQGGQGFHRSAHHHCGTPRSHEGREEDPVGGIQGDQCSAGQVHLLG